MESIGHSKRFTTGRTNAQNAPLSGKNLHHPSIHVQASGGNSSGSGVKTDGNLSTNSRGTGRLSRLCPGGGVGVTTPTEHVTKSTSLTHAGTNMTNRNPFDHCKKKSDSHSGSR